MREPEGLIAELLSHLVPITKRQFCIIKQQIGKTKTNLTQLWFETRALQEVRKEIIFLFRFSFCD